MSLLETLKIETSYLMLSSATQRPYLDENRNAYLFFNKDMADLFANNTGNIDIGDPEYREPVDIMAWCFRNGAKYLILDATGKQEKVRLCLQNVKRDYYAHNLTADINLYKETKKHDFLYDMAQYSFVVPARIPDQKIPILSYASVKAGINGKKQEMYLAFTDLDEYKKWEEKVKGWNPLLVRFDFMAQIGKQHGYVINLFGNRLVLEGGAIRTIEKRASEKKIAEGGEND